MSAVKRPTYRFENNKSEVLTAGCKGRGIFATQDIKEKEVIEVSPALLVPKDDEAFILNSFLVHYTFATSAQYEDEQTATIIGLGNTSLYNHSDDANADFTVSSEKIIIHALQDIAKGDEITLDYGWEEYPWKRK